MYNIFSEKKFQLICTLRNQVSTKIKESKASYYSSLFNEVRTAATYWRLLKKQAGTTTSRGIGPLKRSDGSLTTNDSEKAGLLNEYFSTVADRLIGPAVKISPMIPCNERNLPASALTDISINQNVVKKKLQEMNVRKATGPDGVSARLLKLAGPSIVPSLVATFEFSAKACKLPDQWKVARVSAAFKKGSEEDKTCYRPLVGVECGFPRGSEKL